MDSIEKAFAQAQARQAAGDLDGAVDLGLEIIAAAPGHLGALELLGRAVSARGQHPEAVAFFAEMLRLEPGHPGALANLAAVLHAFGLKLAQGGQLDNAAACFQQAAQLQPGEAQHHLQLGAIARMQGRERDAILHLERTVALDPRNVEALLGLGDLHGAALRFGPAAKWYRWALAVDPDLEVANSNLSAILEDEARINESRIYRSRIARPQPLHVEKADGLRVLIPWAAGSGNVPIDNLIPRDSTTRIRWNVECSTDEQEAGLPPFDVVFNAIGNADIADLSYPRLSRFAAAHPMLNPPDKVLRTRRDLMPALLEGIPGLTVPRVLRLRRDEVLEGGLGDKLAAAGLACPVIVRPIGTQGGHGAVRVDAPEGLEAAADTDVDAYYLIAFHDTRGPDGHFRKYRMIFVDREPFPYHLAISTQWLVHYFSADMLAAPWKREEERRFMEDPAAVLGPAGLAAVTAVARRLDLDYGGIDFTLDAEGRILVFEANATMLVHLKDDPALFPYKHEVVPRIYRAFQAMLRTASAR
jgi:tetratricopeptide (TPR) repeat protein